MNLLKKLVFFSLFLSFVLQPLATVFAQEAVLDTTDISRMIIDDTAMFSRSSVTTRSTSSRDASVSTTTPIVTPDTKTPDVSTPVIAPEITSSQTFETTVDRTERPSREKSSSSRIVAPREVKEPVAALSTLSSSGSTMVYSANTANTSTHGNQKPQADTSTGALQYSYKIDIPAGRNGLTPELSLSYNNQNDQKPNYFGNKWNLSIPYIQRLNKSGTNKLYTSNDFTSSIDGELVLVSGTTYVPKVENGNFLKYNFTGTVWTITDKQGTVYTYGASANSRQDDTSDTNKIYKWMLENVTDTNNNVISYTYFKDSGEIYPNTINYANIYQITFDREMYFSSATMPTYLYYPNFKVSTSYRIKTINILLNNQWFKKYDLQYTTGDAGYRALLASITLSTKNLNTSAISTFPSETYTYKTRGDMGWDVAQTTAWQLPQPLTQYNGSTFLQMQDLNGDTYPDVALKEKYSQYGSNVLYINNTTNGWTELPVGYALLPIPFRDSVETNFKDWGTRIFDVNGDMRNDMVRSFVPIEGSATQSEVYISNRDNTVGYTATPSITVPTGFVFGQGLNADNGIHIADINGDGFPDILRAYLNEGTNGNILNQKVYLGNGNGFELAPAGTWAVPHPFVDQNPYGPEVYTNAQIVDINGDSLSDIIWSYNNSYGYYWPSNDASPQRVFINNGHGWDRTANDGSWTLPTWLTMQYKGDTVSDGGIRENDMNGDNIPDLLFGNALINSGNQQSTYAANSNILNSNNFANNNGATLSDRMFADANADGANDFLFSASGTPTKTNLGKVNNFTDTLIKITKPQGATYNFGYKRSNQYRKRDNTLSNPNLPIVIDTINTITQTEPVSNTVATTTYTYADGTYFYNSPSDRKFAGFGMITMTDPQNNVTKTFYHQGNTSNTTLGEYNDVSSKIGKVFRTEIYDANNNLYQVDITKWDSVNIAVGADFVFPAQTLSRLTNGGAKDIATSYTYNTTNGDLNSQTNFGEVTGNNDGSFTDVGTDKYTTTYTYAISSDNKIHLPSSEIVTNQNNVKEKENQYFYDALSLGSVTKGNNTKTSSWISGANYASIQNAYNVYGLKTSTTDPRGNVTNYIYDVNNLYPATITNPLSQSMSYTYDYSLGKPKQITDINGKIYSYTYDGFGRPTSESVPDPSTNTSVLKTSYIYTDIPLNISIKKSDFLDASNSIDSYSYFDSFSRPIQTRTESETGYNVTDTIYDALGRTLKQSLPYGAFGAAKSTSTGTANLYTTYTYDALSRVTIESNALGTTTHNYSGFSDTITDANNKQKKYTKDAYGNLTQVTEFLNGSVYNTNYTYNSLQNLLSITDALGNVRNFTYDNIGRRISAQDLHVPSDTTYGTYTYAYDNAGNITQTINPNAKTINYTYNTINQQLTEDETSVAGVEISYTYGGCANGVGKLCNADRGLASTGESKTLSAYTYNNLGNIASEIKNISGTNYATSYTYDRLGNILTLTYPDLAQSKYTYNAAGLLEKVDRNENGGAFSSVVTNFDYSPLNQITTQADANNVTTTNTYDNTKLYRLTRKLTQNSSAVKLQDLNYTYDNVGNITKLIDASATASAKTVSYVYDDLYRMTSASTTTGTQNLYTENYTYDILGNILNKNGQVYKYEGNIGTNYANPHAMTSIIDGRIATTYTYDKDGNVLNDGKTSYTWNYKDQLVQVVKGTVTNSYFYDNTGQRVKTSNTTTTDPRGRTSGTTTTTNITYPNKYYNVDNANKKTKSLFGGTTLLATVETAGTVISPYYVHTDHLNSTTNVTSAAGASVEMLDYLPYGNIRLDIKASSFTSQRKYIGQQFDASTGLNYLNARYYNNTIGKFMSEDPVFWTLDKAWLADPQNQNAYAYARNNPVNLSDPSGRSVLEDVWNGLSAGPVERYQAIQNSIQQGSLQPLQTSFSNQFKEMFPQPGDSQQVASNKTINFALSFTGGEVPKGLSLGQDFGKLGKVVVTTPGELKSFTNIFTKDPYHGLNQAITRAISPQSITNIVENPLVKLQQGTNSVYLSKQGGVILDRLGGLITAYSKSDFKSHVLKVLKNIKNK